MSNRYKLIISNKNLYKEVAISEDSSEIRIGTSFESDVRLRKELFFSPVEIVLTKDSKGWSIFCSDNLYISVGDIRKLITKRLSHGDEFCVKYHESNTEVFALSFVIDFDIEGKRYDLEIDISGKQKVRIGGTPDCDICYSDEYLGSDSLSLEINGKNVSVVDNGSRYGVYVNSTRISGAKALRDYEFFSIVGLSFFYKQGKIYASSSSNPRISGLPYKNNLESSTCFTYPNFNRNTRVQYVVPEEELEIQQPPPKPQKSKKNIVLSLIPSLVMLAMTIVLRGIMGGGGTFVIYSAISMSLGIVMSIVTFITEGKEFKKDTEARTKAYNEYIEKKTELIESSRENELRVRDLTYQSLDDGIEETFSFGKRLFERSEGDADYLHIYLGKGKMESANQVKFTKQEFADTTDPLSLMPEQLSEKYRFIENAPIVSNFHDSCGVGVVGSPAVLSQMLKNISLDIAIRHFYSDVKMVYILGDNNTSGVEWARWLHNVENERLDIRNIAYDEESRNLILEDLYVILSEREQAVRENSKQSFDSQYVVFVTDVSEINRHPVAKVLDKCSDYGFTFVFFEEHEEMLPAGCTEIIRLGDNGNGVILKSENGDVLSSFAYPAVSDAVAEKVALKLGAVHVDEVTLESELTKNITMFELLGILSVDDIDLETRWKAAQVYRSLAAPLGVKNKGQVVYLDISDKSGAHGPHGLVAGTTGSGKSEILQTYILSIATLYHPYEVGFVIIDFKGGGMANQFRNLPHLIGTITNIDGREINRSLLSIKAELVKRQELFSRSGVNHINDYIKLFKAGKVTEAMPHLIMVVDEFAELKAEHPDFMKELISAARIGRTLGVHLILATQKPAGVVDAQIWSNSKFKLCLKVQTREDSNEVIKTPLAAEIVEPGRAYFQVGNNEIFDLFQSAYSGASVPEGNNSKDNVFAIYERNLWGKRELKYTNKKENSSGESVSQLQAIVDHVSDYCAANKIAPLPGICLPSLPDRITTDVLDYSDVNPMQLSVPVAMFDDPEQQRQGEVVLELSRNNVYIVGSAQMGKTVLLQTICYGLIRKYTPKQVNMYLIDCGSMVLKMFEDSKHVGGVVLSNEDEKCKNLFKLLNTTIAKRKKILSGKGVGNYAAYLEAGYTDMPMIVVAIDNMAAFKEYFPEQADELTRLSREAQGVGISFIITAANANALNYRTLANFGEKLVLNCIDSGEYSNLFGHCRVTPKENPGRGLIMMDKRILEYQVALFGQAIREADRSKALMEYIAQRNEQCSDKAMKIPMVPEKLSLAATMAEDVSAFRTPGIVPIGMDFASVALTNVNISTAGSLALIGEGESREAFVHNFLATLSKTAIFHNVRATVVDDRYRKLQKCSGYGFVREYTSDASEAISLISDFCDDVRHRAGEDNEDIQLLVINSVDVIRKISADKNDSKDLALALKSAGEANAFILLSGVENLPVGFNASELYKAIKEERRGILFAPITENKLYELSARAKANPAFDNSMGYFIDAGLYSRIKIFDREV